MDKASKAQIRSVKDLLRDKKARDEGGIFVAEGLKIVADILAKGKKTDIVFLSSKVLGAPSSHRIEETCREKKINICRIPAAEFEQLSSLRNSQGVLAVVQKPSWPPMGVAKFAALCDGIQDPGNLGAIIRTAAAFGADSVLLHGETADIYNPKVVRASSGTVLDIPIYAVEAETIIQLKAKGCSFLGASVSGEGSQALGNISLPEAAFVAVFGSEGKGISKEMEKNIDAFFHIPIDKKVESLNVTAAAAIALYVMREKRR